MRLSVPEHACLKSIWPQKSLLPRAGRSRLDIACPAVRTDLVIEDIELAQRRSNWSYTDKLSESTAKLDRWCEGIADTFVQLFLFSIAVLIAKVDRSRKVSRSAPGGPRLTLADGKRR